MVQIVVDTNVLVAAMRSRWGESNRLLRHLGDPRWQVNISAALILEYEEVLRRQAMAGAFSVSLVEILVDRFKDRCQKIGVKKIGVKDPLTPILIPPDHNDLTSQQVTTISGFSARGGGSRTPPPFLNPFRSPVRA